MTNDGMISSRMVNTKRASIFAIDALFSSLNSRGSVPAYRFGSFRPDGY